MSQSSGYAPPPSSGKPWWVWALGGCGGCLLLFILGFVAIGVVGYNAAKRAGNNQQSYRKGQDVIMVQEQKRRDGSPGTMVVVMRMSQGGGPSDTEGPITPEAVQESLGVPAYPGSVLNVQATEMSRKIFALTNKISGKVSFRGVGAYTTADPPAQVAAFYNKKMAAAGWTPGPNPYGRGAVGAAGP
jgi:hypothetical protein